MAEIAQQVGRHRSTIYRELTRNRCRFEDEPELNGYYCSIAHGFAADRRRRRAKLLRDPELQAAVIDRLAAGWSPEQIAGRMRHENLAVRVCHETIYAFVYSKDGQAAGLARHVTPRGVPVQAAMTPRRAKAGPAVERFRAKAAGAEGFGPMARLFGHREAGP
ncbi:helix-turn-helix domain-containing protein [Mangrovicoccus ximenensis]|uniref:helix-turn-helix domain-containing protein n=1 Tax=Mangrovicoccus ximenensis TaxID=1911570 RepID=UPI000D3D60EC